MVERKQIHIQAIEAGWLQPRRISMHILRLDKWHPVVSGNKWFKLYYYLQDAVANGFDTIATFGGAYSNHIVATAFACREAELKSIGIIRGEQPLYLSHTLLQAQEYGMQLQFVSRETYKNKEAVKARFNTVYWVNEGGYGSLGAKGAAGIVELISDFANYTHIACAVGMGTTLAGLIKRALPHQTVAGYSALKNNASLTEEVKHLLPEDETQKRFTVVHDYHFGGYAKHTPALLGYMNEMWQKHSLPLDFVYTAKAMYGLQDMIAKGEIMADSRILFVHTGGLQGNLSLPEGSLLFS